MGWKEVGKGEGGSALPFLKFDKPVRIRLVGPNSIPDIAGNSKFDSSLDDGPPFQAFAHWAPDEFAELAGGPRTVACITIKGGCIFHEEPLKWRGSKSNYALVVHYEGFDIKKKTFDSKKIEIFQGGVMVFQTIRDQAAAAGVEPDAVDWIISKQGKGLQTTYTAVMITDTLEKTIDLQEFDDAPIDVQDEEIPVLIDLKKLDAFRDTMTAQDQVAWYEAQTKPAAAETETDPASPPAAPAAAPRPAAAAPAARIALAPAGAAPNMEGRPGRHPNNCVCTKCSAKRAAAGGTPPAAAPPAPPAAAKTVPNPEHAEYVTATAVADPWGTEMGSSKQVDFIIETGLNEEYQITQEILDAAMLVKAGEPPATITVAAAPPRPAVPAAPGQKAAAAPPVPKPAPAAAKHDIPALQERLLQLRKDSVPLKNFTNMKKFLTNLAGGVKTIQAIEDGDLLLELIALLEAGDDELLAQLGE